MTHRQFIRDLGGGAKVARMLDIDTPGPVGNWGKRGVPWRWRPALALIAGDEHIELPEGFLGLPDEAVSNALPTQVGPWIYQDT